MFGYVRPAAEELRVREYAYYRAGYCGLCKTMAKRVSPLFSLSLRYDFVALVLVRMLLAGDKGEIVRSRCAANPLKKRPTMKENPELLYTARVGAVLGYYGVLDNCGDEHGLKKLGYTLIRPLFSHFRKKAQRGEALPAEEILRGIEEQAALESRSEPSPDAAAEPFGHLLGSIFSFGLSGEAERIARSVGEHLGKYIYLCDAVDDLSDDEKEGKYNPLLLSAQKDGKSPGEWLSENREALYLAMRMHAGDAYRALSLIPRAENHPAWACLENIFTLGLAPERAFSKEEKKRLKKTIHDGSV